ncbi:cyclodehydratase [Actinomyces sp. ZJ308]|uniref:cyclodehydratase n=1 Tax=Actinomyces sp. ZJ308 TaxID=2708342 RepID=UPI0014248A10|nr:cyclodehydratase [Actinomyces sp. ZJ308]
MSTTPPAPAAQPVQQPAQQAPSGPVTAYLPQGGFARAVAARLAGPDDVVVPVDQGLVSAYVPYADRAVLIADPDQTGLREDLDTLSFTRGMPSLGLELLPTELRCGPLVVPGRSACYRCYDRRRRQHGYRPLPPEVAAEHGPLEQGYAHHHVVLGAGLISLALQTLDRQEPATAGATGTGAADAESAINDAGAAPVTAATTATTAAAEPPEIGGRVWTIDLVSGITTCSPTVAVDRCETCSGRYEGRRDGLPALAALLPERREEVA